MTVAAHAADGNEASSDIVAHLTLRELEVLAYLPSGKSNREIGTLMFLSQSTVKAHLTSLYAKLGVSNRTEAALVALDFFPILKVFLSLTVQGDPGVRSASPRSHPTAMPSAEDRISPRRTAGLPRKVQGERTRLRRPGE